MSALLLTSLIGTGIVAGGVATGIVASTHPRARLWGPVCWRGPTDTSQIALTFDDGPTPGCTEPILQILAASSVKATFFVIGRHVVQHPQLLKQMHEAGHLIANHSFDHPHHGYLLGRGYWLEQIRKTNAAVEAVIGKRPVFFRPPMGIRTWRVERAIRQEKMRFVTWTQRGFDGLPSTPQRIQEWLIPNATAGDILVLHDGVIDGVERNPQATVDALPGVISALQQMNLELARLDLMLRCDGYFASHASPR